jgi:hypothetical protein
VVPPRFSQVPHRFPWASYGPADNVPGKCKLCPRTKRASVSERVRVSSNFVEHVTVSIDHSFALGLVCRNFS